MQQRLVQFNFDGALELSVDTAEADVKKRKADCAAKVAECAENRKKQEKAATTAVLLERDMGSATVRATSMTPPSGKQANIIKLERRGSTWKVVSFAVDDGSYKPTTPSPMEIPPAIMQQAMTPPSAAPSGAPVIRMNPPPPAASAKP
jgi:hypothetical protein